VSTYLALGDLVETSGSNSRGKPKKPLNLSKVTCATWRTLVGQLISMVQRSPLPSLLQAINDFLKRVTRMASSDSSCCVLSVTPRASQSVTVANPSTTADEGGAGSCSAETTRMPSEEEAVGDEEEEK